RPGLVEQRLDLLFLLVGQLLAVAIEELDAVVLGRVMRRSDHAAEVERQQRHGRRRQHAGNDRVPARGRDAAREGFLELDSRSARVAPDEDPPAPAPERRCAAEALDEVSREILTDDATDTVRAEVLAGQGLTLTELRRLARLV